MCRHRGFTLIELLVVIAIISLLVSMLLPALKQAKELARLAVCASNLRTVMVGAAFYGSDHGGWLPPYGHVGYPGLNPCARGSTWTLPDRSDTSFEGGIPYHLAKRGDYLDDWHVFVCPNASGCMSAYFVGWWEKRHDDGAGLIGYFMFNGNRPEVPGYNSRIFAGAPDSAPGTVLAVDRNLYDGTAWGFGKDRNGMPKTSHSGINTLYADGHVAFAGFLSSQSAAGLEMMYVGNYSTGGLCAYRPE